MSVSRSSISALVAGGCLPLAFSPFHWVWVEVGVIAVLFWLLLNTRPAVGGLLGWLFGVGMFGVGVSWIYVSIHDMGQLSVGLAGAITVLFVALLALFIGGFGTLAAAWRCRRWVALLLVFPALWVLFEWLRGSLFTGFAWLWLGHVQVDGPLQALLPLGGSLLASWLVAISAGAVVLFLVQANRRTGFGVAAIALLWVLIALFPDREWTQETGQVLSYSLIQDGRPQQLRWSVENRVDSVRAYLALTEDEWGTDLVVWPENAVPMFYHQVPDLTRRLHLRAEESGTTLLAGMPYMEQDTRAYFNSVLRFPETGSRYDKRHLVPFTEYLPMREWLSDLLDFFQVPMSAFSPGRANQRPLMVGPVPVGVSVCYEAVFARDALATLPDAGLLVNLSNDGWFGDSLGPYQHLQIARVRAAEGERPLLRATNTGITAMIDHHGELLAQAPRAQAAVLRGEVAARAGATPYVRWGNAPLLSVLLVLLLVSAGAERVNRRR